jgi:hypothetical protein
MSSIKVKEKNYTVISNLIGIFLTIHTDTKTKAATSIPNLNTADLMSLTTTS